MAEETKGFRVKIVSDGSNTRVLNAETGEFLQGVCNVSFTIGPDGRPRVQLTLIRTIIELVGEVVQVELAPWRKREAEN